MTRHTRQTSSHSLYVGQMPVSMAPSPMYDQQRMAMPANYYAIASSASNAPQMQIAAQQPQQQPHQPSVYEDFIATSSVSLPPSQHRASSGAWTQQDDHELLTARMKGLNWANIRKEHFPSKSANACRKRHERLMERKNSDDWDNRKLERLAKEYMSMRKEIWSGLAARTGEKWNVVEQKCMSNGLKNLQSASRAASRRDRTEAGVPISSGYDDDSGISGIVLTPGDDLDASCSSPGTSPIGGGPHSVSSSGGGSAAGYPQHQHHHHHHHQQSLHHAHLQPHAQAHLQPMPGAQASYAMSNYPGAYATATPHAYSSSMSSTASGGAYATHAGGQSDDGPYLEGQRLSVADLGMSATINHPQSRSRRM